KKVKIVFARRRRKGIGIVDAEGTLALLHMQAPGRRGRRAAAPFEYAASADALHGLGGRAISSVTLQRYAVRMWIEDAYAPAVPDPVQTQHPEGIVFARFEQGSHFSSCHYRTISSCRPGLPDTESFVYNAVRPL